MIATNMETHTTTPAGLRVNSVVLAFTLVAGMAVFLRIFTRLVLTRSGGLEDLSIVIAMSTSIGLSVAISEQVMHGLGKDNADLTTVERTTFFKGFWASIWLYNLTLTFTKVAILVQYLRIFPVAWFRKACLGALAFVSLYGIWAFFSSLLFCAPVAYAWSDTITSGRCLNKAAVWFTNASFNIIQDLVILLLPMPVIRNLKIPSGQKKGLYLMLGLGASVTLVSFIRLKSVYEIAHTSDIPLHNTAHATVSAVEANLSLVCACLPALRPLLALMMPKYFSSATQYSMSNTIDVERPKILKPFNPSMNSTPRAGTPISAPKPIISLPNSRAGTPQPKHTRNDSSMSIDATARLQNGKMNPLLMCPITPAPSTPYTPCTPAHARSGSAVSIAMPPLPLTLQTDDNGKPLPLTPFPVSAISPGADVGYFPLMPARPEAAQTQSRPQTKAERQQEREELARPRTAPSQEGKPF